MTTTPLAALRSAEAPLVVGLLLLCALVGALLTTSIGPGVLGAAALCVLGVAVGAWNRGVFIALVVVGILNGIPGLDVNAYGPLWGFRPDDLLVCVLIGALLFWAATSRPESEDAALRTLAKLSALLIAWWLITLLRSVIGSGISPLNAALYGRDFLYFALLFALMPRAIVTRRHVQGLLVTLGAFAIVFALAAVLAGAGGLELTAVLHPKLTATLGGVERFYSPMNDLVYAALACGAALALLGRSAAARRIGMATAAVAGAATALQLTRAAYVGAVIGFLVVTVVVTARGSHRGSGLRGRVLVLLCLVATTTFVATVDGPTTLPAPVEAVVERAQLGATDLREGTGNFGYRTDLAADMLGILGTAWPVGLGFLHPVEEYVPGLPSGSIRNTDVGVLNPVMTIGVIGTLLMYLPVLACLRELVRRSREEPDWRRYGIAVWLTMTLIASITLVTLFTVAGVVLVATALGIGYRAAASSPAAAPARRRAARSTAARTIAPRSKVMG